MENAPTQEPLSPLKRAILELREMRARVQECERRTNDPIAIVGVGMRLPGGAGDEASLWRVLAGGVDTVTEIPKERWDIEAYYDPDPDKPGKMHTRHGAFLSGVDQFDAEFFGVSPREAISMDPQQRVLLETAWEALENAAINPSRLAGSQTGVFVGYANSDYWRLVYGEEREIDAYSALGNSYSVAAGRLSYFLGLHGPCMTVDTACSSSLVAVHLACGSLRAGECSLAFAAGVNLILTPEVHINFSKARMLAPDGRCKTFDAGADGYVRGEGCGVVLLKPLSAALANGNRVLAVIRGSAVNQDGRSGGLTAPNGPAQEAVLRAALKSAGVAPNEVGYLEAHGTGTSLGDPIEVRAASAVFSQARSADHPLAIGTIKTNFGHLEAAAGIAGLLKVVVALRRQQIPPHLHLQTKSPYIDWDAPLVVPTVLTDWVPINGRRIAALSSFGFSGTNAHLILEEAPEHAKSVPAPDRPLHVLALSAKNQEALKQLARSYKDFIASPDAPPVADVCFTANAGRAHFSHRTSVLGASREQLGQGLAEFVNGATSGSRLVGELSDPKPSPVAFLFTGQGSQYPQMGRALYEGSAVFKEALDRCDKALQPLLDRPLLSVLYPAERETSPLDQTAYTQPALFALEYALSELWRSWGVQPAFVMGHSVGEYVAACVAGVFSLEEGLRLITERARLMQALPPGGRMSAVFADPERVEKALAGLTGVSVAAINGPALVVISGDANQLNEALRRLSLEHVRSKDLVVSHAFHSPLIEPALLPLHRAASEINYREPQTGFISNLTGEMADARLIGSADYWRRHAREPVQFARSIQSLEDLGVRTFVEIGPNPVLLGMARHCLPDAERLWLPSLRSARKDWEQMLESLQKLYAVGVEVDWAGFDRGYARNTVGLPSYPFQRRRYWIQRPKKKEVQGEMDVHKCWQSAKAAGLRQSRQAPLGVNVLSYGAKWECLERLTTALAAHTLRQFGAFSAAGEAHNVESLISQFGIPTMYRHLLNRWLERLTSATLLRQDGKMFASPEPLPDPNLAARMAETEHALADDPHLLAYLKNCCGLVTKVMSGKESPLETLFPGGAPLLAEQLYAAANPNRYVNAVAAAVVEMAARCWTQDRPLRVLEVGAGTGGTSSALLPLLEGTRTTYLFTDVSDLFLNRARERFATFPFVQFGVFDLEKPLVSQGYSDSSFDVIVAANVVHAARDLAGAMGKLRTLLVPGGFVVLVEATLHQGWFDFTTGLIEGWQHFADDLRGDNPLLSPERWKAALLAHDFGEVATFPEKGSPAEVLGEHVILARVAPPDGTAGVALVSPLPADDKEFVSSPDRGVMPAGSAGVFRQRLQAALPDERVELMNEYVRDSVMQVLRMDPDRRPDLRQRLMDLGLDSLMAVQLRNLLENGLGFERVLPATLMFDYPTIEAISAFLLKSLSGSQNVESSAGSAVSSPSDQTQRRVQELEALSEDEAAALLLKRLDRT